MRNSVLKIFLCLAMTILSQGIMHSQIRIISQQKRDSVARAARTLSAAEGLSFDSLRVDFGTVRESDAPVMAKFRFVNTGRTSLTVRSLSTSCSCVKATLSRYVLKPGESAEITAEYDQKGHPGRHDRYIYMFMADRNDGPSRLAATVMLTGLVVENGEGR